MIFTFFKHIVILKWGYYEFFRYSFSEYFWSHCWTGTTHSISRTASFGELKDHQQKAVEELTETILPNKKKKDKKESV